MEQILKHISKFLIQHDVAVTAPGLLYGKMGIAVFFFHYARYTGDEMYEDYAMTLINGMQEQILQQHVVNYADGLSGIGTSIEYLAQNNFVKVDTNEVLEEIDKKLFLETVYGNHTNVSLFTGLSGLGRYFLFRIAGQYANDNHIGTLNNKMMLIHITDILERMRSSLKKSEIEDVFTILYAMNLANIFPAKTERMIELFSSDLSFSNQDNMMGYRMRLEVLYHSKYNEYLYNIQENSHLNTVLGLYEGLAGIGLYLLSKLDKQHETWMKLL